MPMDYTSIFEQRGQFYNEACAEYPAAREAERQAVLDLLAVQPGEAICDVPAGGGFLTDGLNAALGDQIRVTCAEPSENFAQDIRGASIHVCEMHEIPVPDHTFDALGSLAGLHHAGNLPEIFREWFRVLKPGGRIVVADGEAGSPVARFLNEFVDQHTPEGHDGSFFAEGRFSELLGDSGFSGISESLIDVSWRFPDETSISRFTRRLFYLPNVSDEELSAGLQRYLGVRQDGDDWLLGWQLRFATATAR